MATLLIIDLANFIFFVCHPESNEGSLISGRDPSFRSHRPDVLRENDIAKGDLFLGWGTVVPQPKVVSDQ
jgi:hypothetical protein